MSNLKEAYEYISHVIESDATDAEKRVVRTIMNLLPLEELVENEKASAQATVTFSEPTDSTSASRTASKGLI